MRITTGRPHQIRIHLAAAGHPLTGDPLYGVGGRPRAVAPGLPGDGGYLLHAHRLQLAHPRGTGTLALEARPPAPLCPAAIALTARPARPDSVVVAAAAAHARPSRRPDASSR